MAELRTKIVLGLALTLLAGGCLDGPSGAGPVVSPSASAVPSPSPSSSDPEQLGAFWPAPADLGGVMSGFFPEAPPTPYFELVASQCDDPYNEGRMVWLTVWNRTGRAIYKELPVECDGPVNETIPFPPDPPFLFEYGSASPTGARMILQDYDVYHGFCRFFDDNCTRGDRFYGFGEFTYLTNGSWAITHNAVVAPIGSTVGELKIWLPEGLGNWQTHLRSSTPDNPWKGSEEGYLEVIDPLGRLNYRFDGRELSPDESVYWGVVPMPGVWTYRLTLSLPALQETRWPIGMEYYQWDEPVSLLGFDWDAEDTQRPYFIE